MSQAHLKDPNLLKRQWQLAAMPRKKAHSVLWFPYQQWTVDLYFVMHAMISGHFQVLTYSHNSSLPLILFDTNNTDTCTHTHKHSHHNTYTMYIHTYICTYVHSLHMTDSNLTSETELDKLKYAVFHDLWHKGYYLTPGIKYGGDYLVYRCNPNQVHSDFVAIVIPWQQQIGSIVSLGRLGSKVKKSTLLCSVEKANGPVKYITLQWSGMA